MQSLFVYKEFKGVSIHIYKMQKLCQIKNCHVIIFNYHVPNNHKNVCSKFLIINTSSSNSALPVTIHQKRYRQIHKMLLLSFLMQMLTSLMFWNKVLTEQKFAQWVVKGKKTAHCFYIRVWK